MTRYYILKMAKKSSVENKHINYLINSENSTTSSIVSSVFPGKTTKSDFELLKMFVATSAFFLKNPS